MRKLCILPLLFITIFVRGQIPDSVVLKTVEIQGIRSDSKTPISKTEIKQADIESVYFGQELPLLIDRTPNMTSSTDGGHVQGYTYFRLRGMDQTRINMTLEGVPLNEPEDQGVYFSNYPDFANSISSMEIQRGVGTSSIGVASYAGSINFTAQNGLDRGFEAQLGGGSFNYTGRFSAENKTGLLKNNTSFYTRFSTFTTDGYKYNSGSDGHSFFMNGTHHGENGVLSVIAFTGRSHNQMSWLAVSESDIKTDPRTNYNSPREVDDFMQSMVILKYVKKISTNSAQTYSVFYNRLDGDWDLDLNSIGAGTDLLNYQLGSNFYGGRFNHNFTGKTFRLNAGMQANTYERTHSMSIRPFTAKEYSNVGHKDDMSFYVKVGQDFGPLTTFVDLQARASQFKYEGDVEAPDQEWTFINPKGGIMFNQNDNLNYYASVGKSSREPTRNDMFSGEDNLISFTKVDPEEVTDWEFGFNLTGNKLSMQGNIYYMDFENEITLIGALGSNGLPLFVNVDKSYRGGAELAAKWSPVDAWIIDGNVIYSQNQITDGTSTFEPLYTPTNIVNLGLRRKLTKKINAGIYARYQNESYIDVENTKTAPEFYVINFDVNWKFYKQHAFVLKLNNVTDQEYFTNGYVIDNERYFFVNPPFNVFGTLNLKF